ncbi:MAG: type II toxin-antitoxin system VapC family toxin [Chloroflexi bacterium]|nr:type II toxin-antitoxin system VapC family toxin [Chloroflexota bacterium]MDA1240284.1 type II toxin-antitoxin system VapC family toxin [Chloroflexota bacterium]MQC47997.1 type II toxin-antitoxin system VapC family toxin [Chloroflexota bacterium]
MTYLFDTDTLSNLLRQRPDPALVRRFAQTPPRDQATSSITLGELYYGARRRADGDPLIVRIEELLRPNLAVLPFDDLAARAYGDVRAELERQGTPIGDADSRIASIALVHGLTVVTGNVRHFQRVPGLAVENWLS